MSDPFYLNDYKIKNVDPSQYYLQDVVSSVYLRGQADRGFFDLSGYRFESTTAAADQRQQPVAAVLDYNKTIRGLARRDRRARRRDQDRPQRGQHRARGGGLPVVDAPIRSTRPTTSMTSARRAARSPAVIAPAARQLPPGQPLFADQQLPAARHRRRLHARVRAGLVAAQVRRSDRRDLDAVRLRPA